MIEVAEMRPEVMWCLLQFIYTGAVNIEADWCVELLDQANRFVFY